MTKLRKSKLDSVKPSYVLKGSEYFCIIHTTRDPKDHALYKAAMKIINADQRAGLFTKREKFQTFAEAREHAKEANRRYGTKFGVTVGEDVRLFI